MIQTKLNYNPATFPGKDCSKQPSLTVPDQTMSLRVILERYAKGLPLVGNPAQPIYTPEEDLESSLGVDLRTLDLSEIKELKDSVNQEVREIKERHKKHFDEKQKAKQKEDLRKEIEKEIEDSKQPPQPPANQ